MVTKIQSIKVTAESNKVFNVLEEELIDFISIHNTNGNNVVSVSHSIFRERETSLYTGTALITYTEAEIAVTPKEESRPENREIGPNRDSERR